MFWRSQVSAVLAVSRPRGSFCKAVGWSADGGRHTPPHTCLEPAGNVRNKSFDSDVRWEFYTGLTWTVNTWEGQENDEKFPECLSSVKGNSAIFCTYTSEYNRLVTHVIDPGMPHEGLSMCPRCLSTCNSLVISSCINRRVRLWHQKTRQCIKRSVWYPLFRRFNW